MSSRNPVTSWASRWLFCCVAATAAVASRRSALSELRLHGGVAIDQRDAFGFQFADLLPGGFDFALELAIEPVVIGLELVVIAPRELQLALQAVRAVDDVLPVLMRRIDGQGQRHKHQAHHGNQYDEDLAQQIHVRVP
jgi:hypothetical protein